MAINMFSTNIFFRKMNSWTLDRIYVCRWGRRWRSFGITNNGSDGSDGGQLKTVASSVGLFLEWSGRLCFVVHSRLRCLRSQVFYHYFFRPVQYKSFYVDLMFQEPSPSFWGLCLFVDDFYFFIFLSLGFWIFTFFFLKILFSEFWPYAIPRVKKTWKSTRSLGIF